MRRLDQRGSRQIFLLAARELYAGHGESWPLPAVPEAATGGTELEPTGGSPRTAGGVAGTGGAALAATLARAAWANSFVRLTERIEEGEETPSPKRIPESKATLTKFESGRSLNKVRFGEGRDGVPVAR